VHSAAANLGRNAAPARKDWVAPLKQRSLKKMSSEIFQNKDNKSTVYVGMYL
jgi:hypothetical protein